MSMKAFTSHYGLLAFSVYELFRVHDVVVVPVRIGSR